jgi:hypothetical protein
LEDIITLSKKHKTDEVGIFFSDVTKEKVSAIQKEGFLVHCFNPDLKEEMMTAMKCGVDGLGTNRPDILKQLVKELST